MYYLTEKEIENYRNNPIFNKACNSAYLNGFTKEQMLSELVVWLLDELKSKQDAELERMTHSTSPISISEEQLTEWGKSVGRRIRMCKHCPNIINKSDTTCPHCGEGQ